jgi:hypothetical protein
MYRKALEVNADHVLSINNLCALLIIRARTLDTSDAHINEGTDSSAFTELIHEATNLLQHAQSLAPGFPAYNLA